jgi:hypothetical protein
MPGPGDRRFAGKQAAAGIISLLLAAVWLSGCATFVRGDEQKVTVRVPAGTQIMIDGFASDGRVMLERRRDHRVTLVSADWKQKEEIGIKSRFDWKMFGIAGFSFPVVVGLLSGPGFVEGFLWTSLWYTLPSTVHDMYYGSIYRLEPDVVVRDVPLSPAGNAGNARMVLAVLDLDPVNASKGEAAIVSEMVRNAFVVGGTFTVIEKSNVDKILAEQAFQQSGCTDQACAVKLGRLLNAQLITVGTFGKIDGEYHLLLRLVNVETGVVEYSGKTQGKSVKELEDNSAEMRAQIRSRFRKP